MQSSFFRNPGAFLAAVIGALGLGACAVNQPPIVHQPMSVRPQPPVAHVPAGGAIYRADAHRPLFEDHKARLVGDLLTIQLSERTAASKSSGSSAEREGDVSFAVPVVSGVPGKSFQGAELSANSATTFDGSGSASAENDFTGTITVTVIDVYPNGNLLISGEKQIAMSQGTEFIRFSGVVDPAMIRVGNTVMSTQVADARIEYRANGYIDEAQTMGWLSRFFMNVLPY
jgi:flagellar L-ring protein precursor FlgH